jgi:hypothetical protein
MSDVQTPARRGPGRPKGYSPKQVRAAQRPVEQRAEQRPFIPRTAENRFDIDERNKVPGMSYEWGVVAVLGQIADEAMINRKHNRWRPVPAWRHPELSGISDENDPMANEPIIRGGLRLEWREQEITDQILEMEKVKADDQLGSQFKRLKLGEDGVKKAVKLERKFVPMDDEG